MEKLEMLKKKTHPDLLPFDELPKDERDKDAIFLAFVWLAKKLSTTHQCYQEIRDVKKEINKMIENSEVYILPPGMEEVMGEDKKGNKYLGMCITKTLSDLLQLLPKGE